MIACVTETGRFFFSTHFSDGIEIEISFSFHLTK